MRYVLVWVFAAVAAAAAAATATVAAASAVVARAEAEPNVNVGSLVDAQAIIHLCSQPVSQSVCERSNRPFEDVPAGKPIHNRIL